MKKIILITFVFFALGIQAQADDTNDFFFNRGYEKGYNEGFEAGSKAAFQEAKKILNNYQNNIKAYEIGKYLIKRKKLTYPQIWQNMTESGMKIIVLPSKIENELDISDIFTKFGDIPTYFKEINEPKDENFYDTGDGVNIAKRDNVKELTASADKHSKIITINIDKNWKNEKVLKKANAVYAIDKDKYRVMFFSSQERNNFCSQFKICK